MSRIKHLTIMVKPSSALCNMKCEYCFYRNEAENRVKGIRPFITEEVVDRLLIEVGGRAEHALIAFQGGEPSLIGLDFFKKFVEKEKELAPDTVFHHGFQTNGYTITAEWADFFKTNNFLVGVSFDGGKKIHDRYRPSREGGPTSDRILETISILKEHNVEFNILIVVTSMVAENPGYVWNYLKGKHLNYLQFIPCMDPMEGEGGNYSLTDELYGSFLCALFDKWYEELVSGNYVSIRLFDNFVWMLKGYPAESCDLNGHCSAQYVLESDGQVYPCDFYSVDEYSLGNILTDSLEKIDERRRKLRFIEDSYPSSEECKTCGYFILCRGGCRRYRDKTGRYLFCNALKRFCAYAGERLSAVASQVQR